MPSQPAEQPSRLAGLELVIEPTGSNEFGPCECCGDMSRTVWGFVHSRTSTVAAYFVQWTLNEPKHGANFDVVIGDWGEESESSNRKAVALEYRIVNRRGSFMVVDATHRPVANFSIAGSPLAREQVIGMPIAQDAFAIVDAVLREDERIQEIRDWS